MKSKTEKVMKTISEYEKLLNIIGSEPGVICRMPKTEMSRLYGKSYTGTLKKLAFLERYGLIEKVAGGYIRTEKTLMKNTPIALIPKIIFIIKEHPELYDSFKKQAELLSVPLSEVQTAWGFISYFFGSKNQDTEENDRRGSSGTVSSRE